ncbi:Uncharacterised protein [Mycobacteroides abscessus subsp. abscessus]|nr:Uncharacterised protein [Mycobacteroides abscessus subsp. abscessus]
MASPASPLPAPSSGARTAIAKSVGRLSIPVGTEPPTGFTRNSPTFTVKTLVTRTGYEAPPLTTP